MKDILRGSQTCPESPINGLNKQDKLKQIGIPKMIQGVFFNLAMLGYLGACIPVAGLSGPTPISGARQSSPAR